MRTWIMVVGTAAALAACGRNDQTDDNQDLNRSLTAQNIVANDVTAIDAVTGDAANMAADVDFTEELANELGEGDGNASQPASRERRASPAPSRREPRESTPEPEPAPAATPASNTTE